MSNLTQGFPAELRPDMHKYYDMRMNVRKFYSDKNGQTNPKANDLCSKILQLRDKHRCIESINIDTTNYVIEMELEDGTSKDKSGKILNQLQSIVNDYILKNVDTPSSSESDIEFVKSTNLYDEVVVGNYIKINL